MFRVTPLPISRRRVLELAGATAALVVACTACSSDQAGCLDSLAISVANSLFYTNEPFTATAHWSSSGANCPTTFAWEAGAPLSIVGSASGASVQVAGSQLGTGTLTVRAGSGTEFTASRQIQLLRSTAVLVVEVNGLASGVDADIDLTGPANTTHKITASTTLQDLPAGTWNWHINDVTGGPLQHCWAGVAPTGAFDLQKNDSVQRAFQYNRQTGQVDFVAQGVPPSTVGSWLKLFPGTGPAYEFTEAKQSFAVEPGGYNWQTYEVDPNGFWWVPRSFAGTFTVAPGFDVPLVVDFDAQAGFLVLDITGLPEGVHMGATLSMGVINTPITLPVADYHTPGDYSLDVPDLPDFANGETNRIETYRPVQRSWYVHLVGGDVAMITAVMRLDNWYATFNSTLAVTTDPFANAPLIGLPANAVLRATVVLPAPSSTDDPLITFTGPAPWVSVAGPLHADGTFTATATGTVAGYAGVPVAFTGTMAEDGSFSGTLKLGSDTPPTGIPGGATSYQITADRVLIMGASRAPAR